MNKSLYFIFHAVENDHQLIFLPIHEVILLELCSIFDPQRKVKCSMRGYLSLSLLLFQMFPMFVDVFVVFQSLTEIISHLYKCFE